MTTQENEWVEEGVFRLLAKHFPNGNHGDYVDWINTDTVVIDGTFDLEILAEDIQNLLNQHSAHLVESLTKKINPTDMLEGWERYWEDVGDGRYVERCMECENEHRILQAIDIIKDNK